ncbi:MAG TPA: crosslink repair DNA glycosylase YcaQ family protein [Ktedonobacteraceae bacterium]|nr:crosslink repair DNA glycosylase YcaQ family protein [Ktedonobacteraceae bacterium]
MTLHLSRAEARRFLTLYHFMPTDIPGVLDHLGTVQYDPLNPVGRNPDLVFQARVPGYRVDDWQQVAYTDRILYDSWDKQACLVPTGDWPLRALIREKYHPDHDREILENESETVQAMLAAIDERGPLSSQEFEDRTHIEGLHSWNSSTRTQRVLRSLWACGQLVTHHRRNGRHYYDRPERVIPAQYFSAPPLLDEDAYHRWIVKRRITAVGLLRKTAEAAIWSVCGDSKQRERALLQLVESGELTPVLVGDSADTTNKSMLYYMPSTALKLLNELSHITSVPTVPTMRFLAPLDSILWDRKGIQHIFDFVYTWEVYKPKPTRTWGYYVLPVFYKDHFVARLDSRLEKGIWTIARWWWEPDIVPDADMLDALRAAVKNFLCYLRATDVRLNDDVNAAVRTALLTI